MSETTPKAPADPIAWAIGMLAHGSMMTMADRCEMADAAHTALVAERAELASLRADLAAERAAAVALGDTLRAKLAALRAELASLRAVAFAADAVQRPAQDDGGAFDRLTDALERARAGGHLPLEGA